MDIQRAHKIETLILQKMRDVGQSRVAADIGLDDSTVSKTKNNIGTLSRILAACGLKVVPEEAICYDQDYVRSLEHIAREHLQNKIEGKAHEN